jgi:membrane-associated phospholipid phosphatase
MLALNFPSLRADQHVYLTTQVLRQIALHVCFVMLERFPKITAAPSRPSRLWSIGLVFGILAILAIHFDAPLVALADGTHLRGDARRMIDLAEAFSFGPAAVVIALGVVLADTRSRWFTARLFAYPIVAGITANLAKLLLPRLRPRGLQDLETLQQTAATGWDTFAIMHSGADLSLLGDGSASMWQAFPSGHTATAIGLAIGLSRLYPQARWYFFALAAFAGLQRIVANAHYPSDVLAGASAAMLVCWLFERKSSWSLAISGAPRNAESATRANLSRAA